MKKTFLLMISLTILITGFASADTVASATGSDLKPAPQGDLVNIDNSTTRVRQLEQRVTSLERDLKDQNNAIRNLERDLNEIRRRR